MEGVQKRGNVAGKIEGWCLKNLEVFPQMLRGISAPLVIPGIKIIYRKLCTTYGLNNLISKHHVYKGIQHAGHTDTT